MESSQRPTRVKLELTVYWLYCALIAVVAMVHVYRPVINTEWDYDIALGAFLGDLLVIAALVVLYDGIDRWLGRKSALVSLWNRIAHYGLIALLLVLALFSQLLFVKTGESLDIHVLRFAFSHASELLLVAGGEGGRDTLYVIFLCITPFLVAMVGLGHHSLRLLRNLTLLLPIMLLASCSYFDNEVEQVVFIDTPYLNKERLLYDGDYLSMTERQQSWNNTAFSHWQRGIVSGMAFGTTFGKAELGVLARKAGRIPDFYRSPVVTASADEKPNIVFILLESTRHSEVGAYSEDGSVESKTPFMDRLAADGLLVERAYTTIPHTSKALVGIYCGAFPRFASEVSESEPGKLSLKCLPHLLAEAGYQSAHFQTAPSTFEDRDTLLENAGFDYYVTQEFFPEGKWTPLGYLGLDDRALIEPSIAWMKQQKEEGRPYFASFLTIATHHPYSTPDNIKKISRPDEAYQSYVNAVAYTDQVIGELFTRLEQEALTENTIFVITGDHGEGFAEHGQIAHNGTAYEEGMRVPLILYAPGLIEGGEVVRGLRQHIDIMPTVLEQAGVSYSGALPGKSLITDLAGHAEIITACFYTDYCLNHYQANGMKTIYFYGRRNPEIYDLASDKGERQNLLIAGSESAAQLVEENMSRAARLKNSYQHVFATDTLLASVQEQELGR